MSSPEQTEILRQEAAILNELTSDLRGGYEPGKSYHNWDEHILRGLERIEEIESSGIATDVEDWFVVRAAYIGHDWQLTSIKDNPDLLAGYDCAEALAAEHTRQKLIDYGVSEEIADQVHYCILATNPNNACDTPEARAVCRVDIGNTGDDFESFLLNFVKVQIEDRRLDQLLLSPVNVVKASCDFLSLYLRRSELSLGPEDNFPTLVEQNLHKIRNMGAAAIIDAVRRQQTEPPTKE